MLKASTNYRRELYFGSKEDLGGDLGHLMRGDTYSADYFYPSKEFVDFFQVIDGKIYQRQLSLFRCLLKHGKIEILALMEPSLQ